MKKAIYIGLAVIIVLATIAYVGYTYFPQIIKIRPNTAVLEGLIEITAVKSSREDAEKIVAGTEVNLSVKIKNVGSRPSAPGETLIRFGFTKPMDTHFKSVIFETEKLPLPALDPDQQVEIQFTTPHLWPSFPDFIKNDWPMRQYQAVVEIDHHAAVIGTKAVTYSAYYYAGHAEELPTQVPSTAN